jgi:hypothetical protein
MIEVDDQATIENEKSEPVKKNTKKTEELVNLDDKINAIYDMLPMIRETNSICQFMLENR